MTGIATVVAALAACFMAVTAQPGGWALVDPSMNPVVNQKVNRVLSYNSPDKTSVRLLAAYRLMDYTAEKVFVIFLDDYNTPCRFSWTYLNGQSNVAVNVRGPVCQVDWGNASEDNNGFLGTSRGGSLKKNPLASNL